MAPSGAPAAAHSRQTAWVEPTSRKARRGPRRRPTPGRQAAKARVSAGSAAGSAAGGAQSIQPLDGLARLGREPALLVATGLLASHDLRGGPLAELRPAELGLQPSDLRLRLRELAAQARALLGQVEDPFKRHVDVAGLGDLDRGVGGACGIGIDPDLGAGEGADGGGVLAQDAGDHAIPRWAYDHGERASGG